MRGKFWPRCLRCKVEAVRDSPSNRYGHYPICNCDTPDWQYRDFRFTGHSPYFGWWWRQHHTPRGWLILDIDGLVHGPFTSTAFVVTGFPSDGDQFAEWSSCADLRGAAHILATIGDVVSGSPPLMQASRNLLDLDMSIDNLNGTVSKLILPSIGADKVPLLGTVENPNKHKFYRRCAVCTNHGKEYQVCAYHNEWVALSPGTDICLRFQPQVITKGTSWGGWFWSPYGAEYDECGVRGRDPYYLVVDVFGMVSGKSNQGCAFLIPNSKMYYWPPEGFARWLSKWRPDRRMFDRYVQFRELGGSIDDRLGILNDYNPLPILGLEAALNEEDLKKLEGTWMEEAKHGVEYFNEEQARRSAERNPLKDRHAIQTEEFKKPVEVEEPLPEKEDTIMSKLEKAVYGTLETARETALDGAKAAAAASLGQAIVDMAKARLGDRYPKFLRGHDELARYVVPLALHTVLESGSLPISTQVQTQSMEVCQVAMKVAARDVIQPHMDLLTHMAMDLSGLLPKEEVPEVSEISEASRKGGRKAS